MELASFASASFESETARAGCDEVCVRVPSLAKRGKDRMGVLDRALSLTFAPTSPALLRYAGEGVRVRI